MIKTTKTIQNSENPPNFRKTKQCETCYHCRGSNDIGLKCNKHGLVESDEINTHSEYVVCDDWTDYPEDKEVPSSDVKNEEADDLSPHQCENMNKRFHWIYDTFWDCWCFRNKADQTKTNKAVGKYCHVCGVELK